MRHWAISRVKEHGINRQSTPWLLKIKSGSSVPRIMDITFVWSWAWYVLSSPWDAFIRTSSYSLGESEALHDTTHFEPCHWHFSLLSTLGLAIDMSRAYQSLAIDVEPGQWRWALPFTLSIAFEIGCDTSTSVTEWGSSLPNSHKTGAARTDPHV